MTGKSARMSEKNAASRLTDDQSAVLENVEASLSVAIEQVSKLRTARGTGDHSAAAAEAVEIVAREHAAGLVVQEPPKPVTMRTRIEAALRQESLDLRGLAREVKEPVGKIANVMRLLRKDDLVHNVGSADAPIWTWRVGNGTTTPELTATVRRLISERPMLTHELVEATGAEVNRVGSALINIQRDPSAKILDLGAHGRGKRWFLLTERAEGEDQEVSRARRLSLAVERAMERIRADSDQRCRDANLQVRPSNLNNDLGEPVVHANLEAGHASADVVPERGAVRDTDRRFEWDPT